MVAQFPSDHYCEFIHWWAVRPFLPAGQMSAADKAALLAELQSEWQIQRAVMEALTKCEAGAQEVIAYQYLRQLFN